jgi:Zn-dependent M32 family carboxypeptidase
MSDINLNPSSYSSIPPINNDDLSRPAAETSITDERERGKVSKKFDDMLADLRNNKGLEQEKAAKIREEMKKIEEEYQQALSELNKQYTIGSPAYKTELKKLKDQFQPIRDNLEEISLALEKSLKSTAQKINR